MGAPSEDRMHYGYGVHRRGGPRRAKRSQPLRRAAYAAQDGVDMGRCQAQMCVWLLGYDQRVDAPAGTVHRHRPRQGSLVPGCKGDASRQLASSNVALATETAAQETGYRRAKPCP